MRSHGKGYELDRPTFHIMRPKCTSAALDARIEWNENLPTPNQARCRIPSPTPNRPRRGSSPALLTQIQVQFRIQREERHDMKFPTMWEFDDDRYDFTHILVKSDEYSSGLDEGILDVSGLLGNSGQREKGHLTCEVWLENVRLKEVAGEMKTGREEGRTESVHGLRT